MYTDCSNFDERCSDAHFVPFLFYYYGTYENKDQMNQFEKSGFLVLSSFEWQNNQKARSYTPVQTLIYA